MTWYLGRIDRQREISPAGRAREGKKKAGGPDKAVKKGKLPEHLGRGWILLKKLDDEQVIIRKAEATTRSKEDI